MTAASFALSPQPWPRVDPSRLWRARYALAVATQRHVYGYPPADAARRGYFDVLVEWTEQDATANALPNAEAEPLARAALEALGIRDPRAVAR